MTLSPPAPRCIIYSRVSSANQADEGTSLAGQFLACTAKAKAIGGTVVAAQEDVESGGLYLTRPALQKAIAAIESGIADTIIIYDLSRYSRDAEHQQAIKKRIEQAGGTLVFVTAEYANTPEGNLAFGITGQFAQYERQKIRERTMAGARQRAKQGRMPRWRRPFGYHLTNKADTIRDTYPGLPSGSYVIIEAEAEWVREIFKLYADGASLRDVCRVLNDAKVMTTFGRTYWGISSVRTIIKNRVYIGSAAFGKTGTRLDKESAHRAGLKHAARKHLPDDQWTTIAVPPIISPELFDTCRQRIETNRSRLAGNPRNRKMLTGLLRCPSCNRALAFSVKAYSCPSKCDQGRPRVCTFDAHVNARKLEAIVVDGVLAMIADPSLLIAAYKAQHSAIEAQDDTQAIRRLERQQATLQKREAATIEAQIRAVSAGLNSTAYEDRLIAINAERMTLQKQIDALTNSTDQGRTPRAAAASVAAVLRDARSVLTDPNISPGAKHDLLAQVISAIYPIKTGRQTTTKLAVRIEWK